MKKYRVTEKHERLKTDIILSNYMNDPGMKTWFYTPRSNYGVSCFGEYDISRWLKLGWVEEIQEPEFTKSDMVSFANWCEIRTYEHLCQERNDSFAMLPNIDEWIKTK